MASSRKSLLRSLSQTFPLKKPKVPQELWGAWNAATAGLSWRGAEEKAGQAVDVAPAENTTRDPVLDSPSIEALLDFHPRLKLWEAVAICAIPLILASTVYTLAMPRAFCFPCAGAMCALCSFLVLVLRAAVLEWKYLGHQRAEEELADTDSLFGTFDGIRLHYKSKTGLGGPTFGIHLYHGFGSNVFSWQLVQGRLSHTLNACVTSHDMPAFGLTPRPKDLGAYDLAKNGHLGYQVLQTQISKAIGVVQPPFSHDVHGAKDSQLADNRSILKSTLERTHFRGVAGLKTVLVGHSMGGVCAAEEAIRNPEAVRVLILVAPAILSRSPALLSQVGPSGKDLSDTDAANNNISVRNGKIHRDPCITQKKTSPLSPVAGIVSALLGTFCWWLLKMLLWLLQPVLILVLWMLVRPRSFWKKGLGHAYYQKDFEEKTITFYRLPLLVPGWDWGLIRFIRARLVCGDRPLWECLVAAWKQQRQPGLVQQLAAVASKHGMKVLIVHGSNDKLIPVNNSKRLSALIPGATFVEYTSCGHVPHEEYPQEFVETVKTFLSKT